MSCLPPGGFLRTCCFGSEVSAESLQAYHDVGDDVGDGVGDGGDDDVGDVGDDVCEDDVGDEIGNDVDDDISPKTSSVELLPVRVIEFLGPEKFLLKSLIQCLSNYETYQLYDERIGKFDQMFDQL